MENKCPKCNWELNVEVNRGNVRCPDCLTVFPVNRLQSKMTKDRIYQEVSKPIEQRVWSLLNSGNMENRTKEELEGIEDLRDRLQALARNIDKALPVNNQAYGGL